MSRGSAVILQRTVEGLQAKGYTFVTVSRLLDMGTPAGSRNRYFTTPGDNLKWDKMFGVDGIGRKAKRAGEIF